MRLLLDTSAVSFQVTRAAEARKDFGKDVQKVDRDTGRPQWVVEVLAQDNERGEVIRVTVTGDQPKVTPGQQSASTAWRRSPGTTTARPAWPTVPPRSTRAAVPRRLVLALACGIPA